MREMASSRLVMIRGSDIVEVFNLRGRAFVGDESRRKTHRNRLMSFELTQEKCGRVKRQRTIIERVTNPDTEDLTWEY